MMSGLKIGFYLAVSLVILASVNGEAEHHDEKPQSQHAPVAPIVAVEQPKDKKFYSWGDNTKRSGDDEMNEEKRKFYQWAGKRAQDENDEDDESGQMAKRKFYQWAGKRADNYKRRFYAWAGKRSEPGHHDDSQELDVLKRKFYAWAGKRSDDGQESEEEHHESPDKRKFYAWAGR